jgi:hypothetical protein
VGVLGGAVLAAFAQSVSASLLAKTAVVIIGSVIGGAAGRGWGAVYGLVCGAVVAAMLSAVGGSILGVPALVVGCAALGGWLQYAHRGADPTSGERACRCRPPT